MRCIPCEQKKNEIAIKTAQQYEVAKERAKRENKVIGVCLTKNGLPTTRAWGENGFERLEKLAIFTPDYIG